MLWGIAYGQSTGYLRYDTIRMEKVGGNSELILLNGTRDSVGPLYNMGNGRTRFRTFNGLGIPNRQELIDTAAALRSSAKRFGIEDNISTSERYYSQDGYKFQIGSTGDFIIGDSISGSTAKFQVKNPTFRRPHIHAGPDGNNAAYYMFSGNDTTGNTGSQSADSILAFGTLNSRQIYVQHTPTSYTTKWGFYNQLGIEARGGDSIRLISSNSDLFNAGVSELAFKNQAATPGKKKVQASSFDFDTPSAQLNQIIFSGSGASSYYYTQGYLASANSYILGTIFDTIAGTYIGYLNTGKGASNVHIQRSMGFVTGRVSNSIDTIYAFYALDSASRSANAGDQLIGQRLDQPAAHQYADASAILHVESRSRGSRPAPAMTTGQVNTIPGTKLNGLMVYNTDSLAYFWWDGSVWNKIGGGGGSSSVAWNAITDPTGTQALTFDDGELNAWAVSSNTETFHTYTANSLTSGTGILMTLNSLTSGNGISVTSTSTAKAAGNALYNATSSGANGSSSISNVGYLSTITNTGTTSTNMGYRSNVSGATTNWAYYADAGNYRSTGAAGFYAQNTAGTGGVSMAYDNGTIATIGTTGGVRLDLDAASSHILARRSFVVGVGIDFGNNVALDVYKSASGTANIQNWRTSGGTILASMNQSGGFSLIGNGTATPAFSISGSYAGNVSSINATGTIGANADGSLFSSAGTLVEAGSGTHALLANAVFTAPTITGGSATVTNTATVYISGAPSATVTGANYALWAAAGTIRLGDLGAGTVTSDANGVLSVVSDGRLKFIDGEYNGGLKEVLKLNPVVYRWRPESGMDTEHQYAGFNAQQVHNVLGELGAPTGKNGYNSLQDRAILGALVNGEKQLYLEIQELKKEIIELKELKK